jgi:transposase-like protein
MRQRIRKQTGAARHEHWRRVIEAAEASGGKIRDYCQRRGIRPSQYYYWRQRLAVDGEAGEARAEGEFVLVGTTATVSADVPALELEVTRWWRFRIGACEDERAMRVVLAELAALLLA